MIDIKSIGTERREVNISEWNDSVKAYVKDLDVFERMVFLDQVEAFYDKKNNSAVERAEAALNACIMALVDEDGEPILSAEQLETLKKASFAPVWRVMNMLLDTNKEDDSLKKD